MGLSALQANHKESPSDEALMAQVRDGKPHLLGQLFERYSDRLFRYCWRMNQDRQLSEDLVQEAFCRALRFRSGYRDGCRFEPWIFSILRNLQMDHWRRKKFEGNWDDDAELPAAETLSPSEAFRQREESELLQEAMRRLPPAKRELLVLARFEEMPHEQIAQVLGCEPGAARVRLHRALESLRIVYRELTEKRSTQP